MANDDGNPISEAVDMVKAYARQETIDPLKALGPYLKFGVPGAVAAGLGFFYLILGILRMMQHRGSWVSGSLSWVPYAVTLAFTVALCAIFAALINRSDK